MGIVASRAVLARASKVFRVVIGDLPATFDEEENECGTGVLSCSDDHPTGLVGMCALLHPNAATRSRTFNPQELFEIALLAGKYGCIGAISYSILRMAHSYILLHPKAGVEDLYNLLNVACILDAGHLFRAASKEIALHHDPQTQLGHKPFARHRSDLVPANPAETTTAHVQHLLDSELFSGIRHSIREYHARDYELSWTNVARLHSPSSNNENQDLTPAHSL